ncbi:Bestrophin, RFP-TM, chloride channel-domain-containing protein [Xylariaceae sp. FL0804]|nr:Bestrophin, RFP-TM, chloride channel-domain-containing protein [Xylariaceae sp. FL0804]
MADEGGAPAFHPNGHDAAHAHALDTAMDKAQPNGQVQEDELPTSPRRTTGTPNPFSRKNTSIDLDDYFAGPRDIAKHSKWPLFLQVHGSILPKMIIPLLGIACWATLITALSKFVDGVNLGVSSLLLTITGFVVSLGLSFRSSSAYERYGEGRRYWSTLVQTCQALGRVYWLHAVERPESAKQDLLGKLTAMNLLVAFTVALKHKLRFEPYTHYDDLADLVAHLDTFARLATEETEARGRRNGVFKAVGENLGLSFAQSNPRKLMKRAQSPLGNLPLEILCYLTAYTDELAVNGQLPVGMQVTAAYNGLAALNDVMIGTERVLNTPLPLAYAIAISQITWLYVFLLPFQLFDDLGWITIPATLAASYIILGIFFIGHEVENPFGNDVNDLPLELFCRQVVEDLETISARPKPRVASAGPGAGGEGGGVGDCVANRPENKVLFPYSESGYPTWERRPEAAVRAALRKRPYQDYAKNGTDLQHQEV